MVSNILLVKTLHTMYKLKNAQNTHKFTIASIVYESSLNGGFLLFASNRLWLESRRTLKVLFYCPWRIKQTGLWLPNFQCQQDPVSFLPNGISFYQQLSAGTKRTNGTFLVFFSRLLSFRKILRKLSQRATAVLAKEFKSSVLECSEFVGGLAGE